MFFPRMCRPCLVVGLLLSVMPVYPQDFSELERRLSEHPSLQELAYQAIANREHALAANALPDPEISLGINNVPFSNPSFDRFLPSNKAIGISQLFPNSAGREARSARMHSNANQIEALSDARFAQLRAQLLIELIELNRIEQQRELAYAKNTKYDELTEVVEAEINAGRPVLFRLAEIESERAEVARTLVELDGEKQHIEASIYEKVGAIENVTLPTISALTWNQDPLQFHAVQIAKFGVTIADESVKEAQANWKTNWGLNLTYQQRSSGRGGADANFSGDDWFSVGVKFSVPVWGKRKQAPNTRAAQAQRSSAQAGVRATAQRSEAQYKNLQSRHHVAEANTRVLLEKIDAIRAEIAAQQTYYESGAGDYAPVIDGELALYTLEAQIVTEKARRLSSIVLSNALLVSP